MPDPRVCCAVGLCCENERARRALARRLSKGSPDERVSYTDLAGAVLDAYQLVPLTLEPGDDGPTTADGIATARRRLEKLHARIKNELTAILLDLGHGVSPEGDDGGP